MFGMGFAEILIIAVIAILFLGPDKLPETMVEIAKFFRSVKKTVTSAKESLEEELHISDIKEEALNYKKELTSASSELSRMTDMTEVGSEIREAKQAMKVDMNDAVADEKPAPAAPPKPEVVTFAKKKKPETPNNENENA
ncbi:MAG: Sec-independent protein translocase protein TatB [Sulfurimonadaceae bacterium]|nr:Sec-independent protein translocase protein TatB [Sulfurimonadaceae bacterium]